MQGIPCRLCYWHTGIGCVMFDKQCPPNFTGCFAIEKPRWCMPCVWCLHFRRYNSGNPYDVPMYGCYRIIDRDGERDKPILVKYPDIGFPCGLQDFDLNRDLNSCF